MLDSLQSRVLRGIAHTRIAIQGEVGFGHLFLKGMAADPTATAADGRFWKRTGKNYLSAEGLSGTKYIIPYELEGSKTFDFPLVADGAMTSTTVTVTGAALGDICTASFSLAVAAGAGFFANVTSGNTVTVTLFNKSGGNLDLASGTLKVRAAKTA